MNTSKIIKGVVSNGKYTVTAPIVKEDYGLYLQIGGVELPSTYQVDFSNSENSGSSVTMIGNADGVLIPRQFIDSGKDVFAFLYHVGADYGRTVYKFRIPNKVRPDRTNEEPTPEEQSVIDQAISALNTAVAQTAQDVIDADASAQSAQGYAEQAESARDTAQGYSNNAQTSANNASASAQASANSATASANSASQSAQIKADVEDLVDDAQGYAQASAQSASASANSASQAQGFANNASSSAQSASQSASGASASAQTASAKAQDASGYAQTASQKATESAQSASQALGYKTDAESAKTASQTAQGLAEGAMDSAVSAKTDAESAKADAESARDEAQQAVASISDALADKADIITDTASGSIASFSDGADDLPLKSLVVDINPIQDLHGQDAPYPAGGGKNKLQVTANTTTKYGVTFTVMTDGTVVANGTATQTATFAVGTYIGEGVAVIASGCPSGGNRTDKYRIFNTYIGSDEGNGTNAATPDVGVSCSVTLYVYEGYTATNLVFKPMIRLASVTDATFAPYENICPISGWTQVGVEQRGKNVFSSEITHGLWTTEGRFYSHDGGSSKYLTTKTKISVVGGLTYHISYSDDADNIIVSISCLLWNGNDPLRQQYINTSTGIISIPNDVDHITLNFILTTKITTISSVSTGNFQLELGSTATPYEPYTGCSITIDLGQTVYGGKLYPLEGKAVVDRAIVDLGTLDWMLYSVPQGNLFRKSMPAMVATPSDGVIRAICSNYKSISQKLRTNATISSGVSTHNIDVIDNRYSDATSFESAMSGVMLCYELAEPIEIQLSANQVNSFLGVNNIWADSGDTEVEYRADTKLYIAKKIAEALASLT